VQKNLHSKCRINEGLNKRGSTRDHWRSRCKGRISWHTPYMHINTCIYTELCNVDLWNDPTLYSWGVANKIDASDVMVFISFTILVIDCSLVPVASATLYIVLLRFVRTPSSPYVSINLYPLATIFRGWLRMTALEFTFNRRHLDIEWMFFCTLVSQLDCVSNITCAHSCSTTQTPPCEAISEYELDQTLGAPTTPTKERPGRINETVTLLKGHF
jgi:hypothetical protein